LISLNAANKNSAAKAIQKKFRKKHQLKITQKNCHILLDDFAGEHKAIKDTALFKDFAIDAMWLDSRIIEDCLIELMINKGIVVLPLHDELMCPDDPDIIAVVEEQMVLSYRKILKQALVEKNLWNHDDPLPDYIKPAID
jgi:hypothetical protein